MFLKIFNPYFFQKKQHIFVYSFFILSSLFLGSGLYFSFISPQDYQHGILIKMMFIHVPFSWISMLIYISLCVSLIILFIKKIVLFDFIALQSAKNGAIFCALSLITGSLWGKPAWGVFWVWDARLTSMLCLFLTFCAYIVINDLQENNPAKHKILLIFSLIGAINIPIIKLSVEYWNTLHQPASIMRRAGIAIDIEFLIPLLLMFCGFGFLHLLILTFGVATQIKQQRIV